MKIKFTYPFFVLLTAVGLSLETNAQTQGPLYANITGSNNWDNKENALGAPDGNCATNYGQNQDGYWQDFGFTIPEGSTINGITVSYERYYYDDPPVDGVSPKINIGKADNDISATGFFDTDPHFGNNDDCGDIVLVSFGGPTELWNETWTAGELNASSFGIRLFNDDGHEIGWGFDCIGITVTFTAPLPVKLLNFTAELITKDGVYISWTTATEINNDYFTIEKSMDGIDINELNIVAGAGNSTNILNYFIADKNPYEGTSYYRLRQTDYDGKTETFPWVTINNTNVRDLSLDVIMNPTTRENIHLNISGQKGDEVLVVLRDFSGKEYCSKVITLNNSSNTLIAIDNYQSILPGIYIVVASCSNDLDTKKLIIR